MSDDVALEQARAFRDVLGSLGVSMPECLPGEWRDCGESAYQHCCSYLAAIKARAEYLIRLFPPDVAEALSTTGYQQWLHLWEQAGDDLDQINRIRTDGKP